MAPLISWSSAAQYNPGSLMFLSANGQSGLPINCLYLALTSNQGKFPPTSSAPSDPLADWFAYTPNCAVPGYLTLGPGQYLSGDVSPLPIGDSPRTIELMVRHSPSDVTGSFLVSWGGDKAAYGSFSVYLEISGFVDILDGVATVFTTSPYGQVLANLWHRLTVVFDPSLYWTNRASVYIDGNLVVQIMPMDPTWAPTPTSPLRIGESLNGDISYLSIWNVALTAEQVAAQSENANALIHFDFIGGTLPVAPFIDKKNSKNILTLTRP